MFPTLVLGSAVSTIHTRLTYPTLPSPLRVHGLCKYKTNSEARCVYLMISTRHCFCHHQVLYPHLTLIS